MNNLSNTVADGFINYYRDSARRVGSLAEKLSEEQFWEKPYPYGNSFGNLVLHITGNLNYYIGAQIATTGYVRERELEFAENQTERKDEVLRKLSEAVDIVIETLKIQTDRTWEEKYTATGVDDVTDRFGIYLRCAVHFHHHTGQMIYLVKELLDEGST
jgi:uncharacterized damage-inducible protein DinB